MAVQEYTNEQIDAVIEIVKNDPDLTSKKREEKLLFLEELRPEPKHDFEADIKQWTQDRKDGIQRHPGGPITNDSSKAVIEKWAKGKK